MPPAETDASLAERLRHGDEQAFNVIYQQTHGPVFRYLLNMSGDRSLAEEALQETFLELIRRPEQFDPNRGELRAFLLGVARNKLRREFSARRPTEEIVDEPATEAASPLEELDRSQRADALERALASLPEAYREAVLLCDLEELRYDEAAQALDVPVGTLRSRLHRGRALLVKKLAPKPVEETAR